MNNISQTPIGRVIRLVGALAFVATLLGWFIFFRPLGLGGTTEYVYVSGSSMAGTFESGDLLVSRAESGYEVGDIVVFTVQDLGTVVHRIVSYENDVIQTQGDNHSYVDQWRVSAGNIHGRVQFFIPKLGLVMTYLIVNPLIFAAAASALALASYLPWRRRVISPSLRNALLLGVKEYRPNGGLALESIGLPITAFAALSSLVMAAVLYSAGGLKSWHGLVLGSAVMVTVGLTLFLVRRLFDGVGIPEPMASLLALSGRLYRVAELPRVGGVSVKSAVALRKLADELRLPILHHIGDQGRQTFLLMGSKIQYSWVTQERVTELPRLKSLNVH
jgi:signal peptidase I